MAKKPAKTSKPKKAKGAAKPVSRKPAKAKTTQSKPHAAGAKKAARPTAPKKKSAPKTGAPATAKKRVAPVPPTGPKAPPFPIKPSRRPPIQGVNGKQEAPRRQRALNPKFLEKQRLHLLELRDHVLDQMQGVAQDSLRTQNSDAPASAFGMHQADAGSDAYEKDFALSLLSQEQDALYEIEQALKRIENGSYGICDMSGQPIPQARLEAIPFARYTVECQAQLEREQRGKNRWDTAPQFMDNADNFFEEEEEAGEEEERPKIKE